MLPLYYAYFSSKNSNILQLKLGTYHSTLYSTNNQTKRIVHGGVKLKQMLLFLKIQFIFPLPQKGSLASLT